MKKQLKTIVMGLGGFLVVICLAGIVSAQDGPSTEETPFVVPADNQCTSCPDTPASPQVPVSPEPPVRSEAPVLDPVPVPTVPSTPN